MANGTPSQVACVQNIPDWVVRDIEDLKEKKADKNVVDMVDEKADEAKRIAISARETATRHGCVQKDDIKYLKIAVEDWSRWFRRIVVGVFGSIITSLVIAISQYFMLRAAVYNTQNDMIKVQAEVKDVLVYQNVLRQEFNEKVAQDKLKENENLSDIKKTIKTAIKEAQEETIKK